MTFTFDYRIENEVNRWVRLKAYEKMMIGYVRENIQMPYDRELYLLLLLHIIEIAMHGNFSILIFSNKSDSSIVKQSLQFQSER